MQSKNCCTAFLALILCNTIRKLMDLFYLMFQSSTKVKLKKIMKNSSIRLFLPVNSQQSYLIISCILWKFVSPHACNDVSRARILKHVVTWIEDKKGQASNGWICAWAMVKRFSTTSKKMLLFMFMVLIKLYRKQISVQMIWPN